jgi:hypothetical protein
MLSPPFDVTQTTPGTVEISRISYWKKKQTNFCYGNVCCCYAQCVSAAQYELLIGHDVQNPIMQNYAVNRPV